MDFTLLIVGMDANAYYMARCYHEKYHKKAYLLGKNPIWFTDLSKIVITKYNENLWNEKEFLKELDLFANNHKNEKILLVTATENYIELISKNKERLEKNFYFNYPNNNILKSIIDKETFYKTYPDKLPLPKTLFYDCSKDKDIKVNFDYPVILKASDVVSYRKLNFQGKNKIYKIETLEELNKTIKNIKNGGYTGTLIIQEYIKGDDSYLFDVVLYADKNAKVKRITLAQIGLQEHEKAMVGNAAVLINGFSTIPNTSYIIKDIIKFTEEIGYTGFAEFDLKYDTKDKKFKVLEINARQGRSSYYLTKANCNLIELLAMDLIENKKLDLEILNKEVLLTFVPKSIIKNYIVNKEFKEKALSLWKDRVNPMKYNKDISLKRNYMLLRRDIKYLKDYKNGYWKNS